MALKKKFIYIYICSVLFFIELTGVRFSFLPVGISKILLVALTVGYFIDLARTSQSFALPRKMWTLIVLWLALAMYAALVTILNGINDFAFPHKLFYLMYEPLWTGLVISYFITRYWQITLKELLKAIANALTLHALLAVASYFFPTLNSLFNALLPNLGNLDVETGLRVKGFTNLGGAWLSSIISVGVVILLYQQPDRRTFGTASLDILKILICVAGTFVTGRTGLMLSLMAVATYPFVWLIQGNGSRSFLRFVSTLLLGSLLLFRLSPDVNDLVSEETLNWALEIFMKGDGEMSTSSTEDLKSMLYLPKEPVDLTFGIGFYEYGAAGYMRSDSGYLKTIFSIGVIGAVVFYGAYIFVLIHTLLLVRACYSNRELWVVAYLYLIFFIVEVKEPYLQTIGIPNIIFLIYFNLYLNNKRLHEGKDR